MSVRTYSGMTATGRTELVLTAYVTDGKGIVVYVYGGELPHLGGAVLASPNLKPETTSGEGERTVDIWSMTLPGHKDSKLAELVAKHLASVLNESVLVSAGVHIDYASSEEIKSICDAAIGAADDFVEWYRRPIEDL